MTFRRLLIIRPRASPLHLLTTNGGRPGSTCKQLQLAPALAASPIGQCRQSSRAGGSRVPARRVAPSKIEPHQPSSSKHVPAHTDTMTGPSATSPPTSPPAKRAKTDNVSTTENGSSTAPAATMEQAPALQIKKLSDKARLPTRGSAFAAGYDIYAAKETVIPARGKALVDTDISMAVPAGTCKFTPYSRIP